MVYFTQGEAAELVGVSEPTIKNYIKDLKDSEREGKFNGKNQPNSVGIELLKSIAAEKNPFYKRVVEYEQKISELEDQIKTLKEENLQLREEKFSLVEKQNSEILKLTETLSSLQQQSNVIIAQQNQAQKELESIKLEEEQFEKSSFGKRLKFLFSGSKEDLK
jgi:predicted site-specific integrase-resolvase